jgi:hypothetical protein
VLGEWEPEPEPEGDLEAPALMAAMKRKLAALEESEEQQR